MAQIPSVNLRVNFDPAQTRGLIRMGVVGDVIREIDRAERKHGLQSHSNGTGPGYGSDVLKALQRRESPQDPIDERAKRRTDNAHVDGVLTWEHILTEEFFEALETEDDEALITELEQVAAVAISWAADIRMRSQEGR